MSSKNQSAQTSGQINLSHRLIDSDMSSTVALVDNVTSATDKAISILSLMAGGIDTNTDKIEQTRYYALTAVIDLLKDVDSIVTAHKVAIGGAA